MTTFEMLKITARCALTGHMSAADLTRMIAYGVLAVQATRARDGNAFTYKMHVGSMRGTFRRAAGRKLLGA